MAQQAYSFDVVSKVEMVEVKNAVDQANKEIKQRFDLKDTKSEVQLENDTELVILSENDYTLKAVTDILKARLVKRGVSLKAFTYQAVEKALGGTVRQRVGVRQGITADVAKEISKNLRDTKLKVQVQIQDDQLRVSGKDKDALQAAIAHLKSQNFSIDLSFENYR